MKNLITILKENKVDDAIDSTLDMFMTMEDVESLGEAFGEKYNKILSKALSEFIDGIGYKANQSDKDMLLEIKKILRK